jgi:hypothetical protein
MLIQNSLLAFWTALLHYAANVKLLQAASMAYDTVDENAVYMTTGQPLPQDIRTIVDWMLNERYDVAYKSVFCKD